MFMGVQLGGEQRSMTAKRAQLVRIALLSILNEKPASIPQIKVLFRWRQRPDELGFLLVSQRVSRLTRPRHFTTG